MAKTSKALRKWRRRQKRGAIMKPKTFARIKRRAAAEGKRDPEAVAGAAYWQTARAKFRRARKPTAEVLYGRNKRS